MATRGVNKVILVGNVGKDPDVRYFPSGDAVANFSLATSEVWKDKNTGEPQERTEWHRVTVRGKVAEVVKQYVHKGSKLYVEGKLQTRKWTGQDGQERYTTEVVVDLAGTVQFLDSKPSGSGTSAPYEAAAPRPAGGVRNGAPAAGGYDDFGGPGPSGGPGGGPAGGPPMQDFDDDIPF